MAAEMLFRSCRYPQVRAHRDQSVTRCDHDGWCCQPSRTTLVSRTHAQVHAEAIQLYFYLHCRDSRQKKSQQETKGRREQDARSGSLTKIEVRRETERAVIATC